MYNRCTVIYKFENNTYPRRIRRRSNLVIFFGGKKVRLMGREIRHVMTVIIEVEIITPELCVGKFLWHSKVHQRKY